MRFYLDTSVWGGYFDEEFKEPTRLFFDEIVLKKYQIIVSNEVTRELIKANEKVTSMYLALPRENLEIVFMDEKIISLANTYIREGTLTQKYLSDALHIACATVLNADALISWNFTHMVNFFRIKQYNEINRKFGYKNIDIRTPKEVMDSKKIPKAEEPTAQYGETINIMKLIREIRDELSELYWKDPKAYLEDSKKYTLEFLEQHYAEKMAKRHNPPSPQV